MNLQSALYSTTFYYHNNHKIGFFSCGIPNVHTFCFSHALTHGTTDLTTHALFRGRTLTPSQAITAAHFIMCVVIRRVSLCQPAVLAVRNVVCPFHVRYHSCRTFLYAFTCCLLPSRERPMYAFQSNHFSALLPSVPKLTH